MLRLGDGGGLGTHARLQVRLVPCWRGRVDALGRADGGVGGGGAPAGRRRRRAGGGGDHPRLDGVDGVHDERRDARGEERRQVVEPLRLCIERLEQRVPLEERVAHAALLRQLLAQRAQLLLAQLAGPRLRHLQLRQLALQPLDLQRQLLRLRREPPLPRRRGGRRLPPLRRLLPLRLHPRQLGAHRLELLPRLREARAQLAVLLARGDGGGEVFADPRRDGGLPLAQLGEQHVDLPLREHRDLLRALDAAERGELVELLFRRELVEGSLRQRGDRAACGAVRGVGGLRRGEGGGGGGGAGGARGEAEEGRGGGGGARDGGARGCEAAAVAGGAGAAAAEQADDEQQGGAGVCSQGAIVATELVQGRDIGPVAWCVWSAMGRCGVPAGW
mmetsp:Transcript_7752/g.18632  ORF Transcript_7752/g.18632 Transcript_7752/m.18632 type:complete len:389 (-) Transcript_7752:267-1433(-)